MPNKKYPFTVYANIWTRIRGTVAADSEEEARELIEGGDYYTINEEPYEFEYNMETLDLEEPVELAEEEDG